VRRAVGEQVRVVCAGELLAVDGTVLG
jgi:hypothetical protein